MKEETSGKNSNTESTLINCNDETVKSKNTNTTGNKHVRINEEQNITFDSNKAQKSGNKSSTYIINNEELNSESKLQDDDHNSQHDHETRTDTSSSTPIYVTTSTDSWELTWPIWHMLPHSERKDLALKHGFRTIGDFEENMILNRALTTTHQEEVEPYDNQLLYEREHQLLATVPTTNSETSNRDQNVNDDDDDDETTESDSYSYTDNDSENYSSHNTAQQDMNNNGILDPKMGGYILLLPDDIILHYILPYLPIDAYATCALVSPLWRSFTRTEQVYHELCKRSYLIQSKRKVLNIARFNHSYKCMLHNRPRVKTGSGLYVLKCTEIKKIQRDMWTEVPIGAILESTYYRYFYFLENGTVLYALTSSPPQDMTPRFRMYMSRKGQNSLSVPLVTKTATGMQQQQQQQRGHSTHHSKNKKTESKDKDNTSSMMKHHQLGENDDHSTSVNNLVQQHQHHDKNIIQGSYQVQGPKVTINVSHSWHHVRFGLKLLVNGCPGSHGKFWAMEMVKHWSSASGTFDEESWNAEYDDVWYGSRGDVVRYKVPHEPLRFLRDWRL